MAWASWPCSSRGASDSRWATQALTLDVLFVDLDANGLPDSWEVSAGFDPANAGEDNDTILDGDGVGGNLEMPQDTDGDGIPDAGDDDSDGDAIPDAEEAGDTDLSTPIDTDGDGVSDFRDLHGDGVEDAVDNCTLVTTLPLLLLLVGFLVLYRGRKKRGGV